MNDKKVKGDLGEQAVCDYLIKKGCRIVKRNFRCRMGEIDIIASDGSRILFVEVKLRSAGSLGSPREYVTATKQRKIISAAMVYLSGTNCSLQPRFDVAEVLLDPEDRTESIEYYENAFEL